jgi:hypothetical protein
MAENEKQTPEQIEKFHTDRAAFLRTLAALATFYENHPDLPAPHDGGECVLELNFHALYYAAYGLKLADVVRAAGGGEKHTFGDTLWLTRDMAGARFNIFAGSREKICRRVVKGTRHVEATPAHEEEIVEWECEPILAEKSNG